VGLSIRLSFTAAVLMHNTVPYHMARVRMNTEIYSIVDSKLGFVRLNYGNNIAIAISTTVPAA